MPPIPRHSLKYIKEHRQRMTAPERAPKNDIMCLCGDQDAQPVSVADDLKRNASEWGKLNAMLVSPHQFRVPPSMLHREGFTKRSFGTPSIESMVTGEDISLLAPLLQSPPLLNGPGVGSVDTASPDSTRYHVIQQTPHNIGSIYGGQVDEGLESLTIETTAVSNPPSASSENGSQLPRLPQQAAGRQFIDAYFRHVHLAYPFLDRNQILLDVEAIGDPTLQAGLEGIPIKLYVIMAIGCTTLQRAGKVGNELSAKFIISYQNIIHECLQKNDIESLELLMLLALYSLFDPGGISPWAITGIVTRQAISLGLTRNASSTHGLYSQQVEQRNRLFWSIYVLDRVISTSYGLPAGINDENINIPLPGITIQEYASADCHYYTKTLQVSRHIIALQQLEAKILQKIHFTSSQATSDLTRADKRAILQDLRNQVENWYKQGCVLSGATLLEQDTIPFHNTITWLNFRYQNLLVLLHCPSQFNSQFSLEQLTELRVAAQKYVQSSAILFQQRHLPLNWVMLCRFLAMGTLLLNCFNRQRKIGHMTTGRVHCTSCAQRQLSSTVAAVVSDPSGPFEAAAELILCADILDLFPERWHVARRSAQAFRRFADCAAGKNIRLTDNNATDPSAVSEEFLFHSVRDDIVALAREVLGETSLYTAAATSDDSGIDLMLEWTYLQHVDTSGANPVTHSGGQLGSGTAVEGDFTLGLNGADGFGSNLVSNLGIGIF